MLTKSKCKIWEVRSLGDEDWCGRIDGRWCSFFRASGEIGNFLCNQVGQQEITLYWRTVNVSGNQKPRIIAVELEDGQILASKLPKRLFGAAIWFPTILFPIYYAVVWAALLFPYWYLLGMEGSDALENYSWFVGAVSVVLGFAWMYKMLSAYKDWQKLRAKPGEITAHTKIPFGEELAQPPAAA